MKKLIIFLISLIFIFASCSGDSNSDNNNVGTKVLLSGRVATGAFMPNGTKIEVRGTAAWSVPEDEEETPVFGPSEVLTGEVIGDNGEYEIDVSTLTAPYLIRAYDGVSGKWYYSYSNGQETVANVNPYTDLMVRRWYLNRPVIDGNPGGINIDDVFTVGIYPSGLPRIVGVNPARSSGILPDNTPINIPDDEFIQTARIILSYCISTRYEIDIENFLTDNWSVGIGYDFLLDSIGEVTLRDYLEEVIYRIYAKTPDFFYRFNIYYQDSDNTIHIDIWSKYGSSCWSETDHRYRACTVYWGDDEVDLEPAEDSTEDMNHFHLVAPFTNANLTLWVRFWDFSDNDVERTASLWMYHK